MSTITRAAHRVLGTRQVNQLVRFVPVLRALDGMTPGRLLDVGSGSTGIAPLLPAGWTVVALDADFADYGALVTGTRRSPRVQGDVAALPFHDGAFDAVVAVDLLEHVPPARRARAVDELCRVASRRAVIACPTGDDARASDRRIRDALVARGATVPPWLDEHLDNGFPTRDELVACAARHGHVDVAGNESAAAHARVTLAELRPATAVPLRLGARVLARGLRARQSAARATATRLVRRLGGSDKAPTYRSVVCVDRRHTRE